MTDPVLQIRGVGGGDGHQDPEIRGRTAPPGLSLGSATATTLVPLTKKKAAFSSFISTTFRGNHASVGQWICRKSITWWPVNIYTLKSRRRLVGEDKTKAIPKPGLFLTGRLSNSLELISYLLDNVFLLLRPVFISYFVSCLNLVISMGFKNKRANLHEKAKPWRILVARRCHGRRPRCRDLTKLR